MTERFISTTKTDSQVALKLFYTYADKLSSEDKKALYADKRNF